ncbi:hypothetical protein KX928_14560 [Roseobacter sp. YSTF-M11]|uniref:Uncharacterized protein n=1 Tax=Roseobacter insulae TaxID=2859783 RepID=A0A9X1FX49_9RHOB|nr:hypothetical protein [Roseobacter insulae]MBW4709009.1 hypothetical protein [Roseobacter insulae]
MSKKYARLVDEHDRAESLKTLAKRFNSMAIIGNLRKASRSCAQQEP